MSELTKEKWVPIGGHEGLYEISNLGQVRRLTLRNRSCNKTYSTPRILIPSLNSKGYQFVCLSRDNRVTRKYIHRMVLEAFVGMPNGKQAAHLNGVKVDNRAANLSWATPKENNAHKILHRTAPFGEKVHTSKLTDRDIRTIRKLRKDGKTLMSIAREFRVSESNVSLICLRKAWSHVQ